VKPKIVYGENVQQTLQYAQTGNVEVAIVALSLALVSNEGTHVTIDEAQHKPIDQALVVCKRGKDKNAALAFTKYVNSAEGRAIMQRYGFLLPGEALVTNSGNRQ
jgi:molybdate transport system substrate-binding protein